MFPAIATLARPHHSLAPLARHEATEEHLLPMASWVPAAVVGLCRGLAERESFTAIRGKAWRLAEQVHGRLGSMALDHDIALARLDALAACWRYAAYLERGWSALAARDWATAMERAGRATAVVTELEDEHRQARSLCERLRARARALWHLADGFDEVAFLLDCEDPRAARLRAGALASQAEQLFQRGLLGEGERDTLEDLLARWHLAPAWSQAAWAP